MKRSFLLLPLLATGLWLASCKPQPEEIPQASWPGYQPFPSGYDYMDTVALQNALANKNRDTLRQHGWSLFAGIMQQADSIDWPIWYTWPNSYDAMNMAQMYGMDAGSNNAFLATSKGRRVLSLIERNRLNTVNPQVNKLHTGIEYDTLHTPYYKVPHQIDSLYPGTVSGNNLIPGKHFLSNGDIMIPTESISLEGYNWIQENHLYDSSMLMTAFRNHVPNIETPQTYVITKHMFWPVLAPSKQPYSAIPVWDETYFNPLYAGYAGYETWSRLVAVDPTNGSSAGQTASVDYLYGVQNFDSTQAVGPISSNNAVVYNINQFYYHKVTAADWASFDANDKAILNASSYWAYGKPFGVGDYLVTIAMHINTKELPTWTMQSVWWTDHPNTGIYSQNRPTTIAAGPWQHYNMVEAYGIPTLIDPSVMPQAMNPYIELVIHPMRTNCNNCHIRAGYPQKDSSHPNYASYQNPTCANLLQKLYPSTSCLTQYTRTDFQWIISDYAHEVPPAAAKKEKK